MDPIAWLEARVPGFVDLTPPEREAIFNFSLLWSFFEAAALNTNASTGRIIATVQRLAQEDKLTSELFDQRLLYFRNRYYENGNPTHHLPRLNLRDNDNPELVYAVLKGERNDLVSKVSALLIIAYRFRNNLFHGVKWNYGIQGQLDNFVNANLVLMAVLNNVELPH